LAFPLELYLQSFYNQGISAHHLGIILETSPKEALEFLGSKVWAIGGAAIGVTWWFLASWRVTVASRDFDWESDFRWVCIALLVFILLLWVYGEHFGTEDHHPRQSSMEVSVVPVSSGQRLPFPKLASWVRIPFDLRSFSKTWPFGLAVRGFEFWEERQYLAALTIKSELFRFGAQQRDDLDVPQVIVMVIGESSRYDRWSINGYARDTNPMLKQEKNLISLSDVVTAVSATRLSVPVLVSRKPATQSLRAGFVEKSFLSAFREAGFKTYWLSNQMSFGKFDTPVSVYAKEADVTQFLNLGGFDSGASFDEVLLEPLKVAMKDPAKRKLIVLHTLGNHWNYSHRYPEEFDRWQPSLFGVSNPAYTDTAIKASLNNSYDNSVLYTDWFLAQVISELKGSEQITAMMYVSDHGQALYDGSCKLAFHGHNTQFEFHIPALVWYSDLYQLAFPSKVTWLHKNRDAKLATENIFHTLLDMADIRYSTEQLEWSFVGKYFRTHRRYVDSYGWTDYDNATFRGDCREVIDKGKPLAQEK
jgi:glucan phosphoethanolaminetransferase (alkaline phosphatase superfamily)